MNKRIKELAEQAQDWADAHAPFASEEHEYFAGRFAELIIRECAVIASINQHQYESTGMYVLKHFGVEG